MNYDLRHRDLATVLAEASVLAQEAERAFGRLSAEQLNYKPSETEWSVGQCFDHLIIANRPYVPIFEQALAGQRRARLWERVPLLPRLFGTLLINTLRPDSGRKARAPRALQPSRSHIATSIIATFLGEHDRLRGLMEAGGRIDLARITITSPVLPLVTYSLLDACRIIVVHEQNHFVQATRVMASPRFPR